MPSFAAHISVIISHFSFSTRESQPRARQIVINIHSRGDHHVFHIDMNSRIASELQPKSLLIGVPFFVSDVFLTSRNCHYVWHLASASDTIRLWRLVHQTRIVAMRGNKETITSQESVLIPPCKVDELLYLGLILSRARSCWASFTRKLRTAAQLASEFRIRASQVAYLYHQIVGTTVPRCHRL